MILLAPAIAFFLHHGPTIDVNIAGTKQPTIDAIELSFDGIPQHAIHPISITPNPEGPMAVVFVVCGSEITIGNDDVETDPNKQYQGILKNLEAAVDKVDLATRMPPDSEAGIVMYATGASVRMPLSSVAQLNGSSFGAEKDYRGQKGSDLAAGLETGIDELARAGERTKVMVVIDSRDDQPSAVEKRRMEELVHRAEAMHIAIAQLVYSSEGGWPLVPSAKTVASRDGLASEIAAIAELYKRSFKATFDISKIPVRDGKPHNVTVTVEGHETAPIEMNLGLYTASARWWTSLWIRIVLAAAVLVLAGVVALRVVVARRTLKASA